MMQFWADELDKMKTKGLKVHGLDAAKRREIAR
jgi:hypothetical protein